MSDRNSTETTSDNLSDSATTLSRRGFMQRSAGALLAAGAINQLLPEAASAGTDKSECSRGAESTATDIEARYRRAQYLDQLKYTRKLRNTTLFPHWVGDSNVFWYVRELPDEKLEYRIVDAKSQSNQVAFDHEKLARSLAHAVGKKVVDRQELPLQSVEITLTPRTVSFEAFNEKWRYDDASGACTKLKSYPKEWGISPDGKKAVFVRDYNLWLRDLASGSEKPLTTDGEKFYVYSGMPTVYGRQEGQSLEVSWSSDSKWVFTHLIDTREVKVAPPLIQHVPTDGTLRPNFIHPDRRVAFPEDEHIECYRFVAIDVVTGQVNKADFEPTPVLYPPYVGYFSGGRGWWNKDNRRAYFVHLKRGGKNAQLVEFDTHTGNTRVLIDDPHDGVIAFQPISHLVPVFQPLPETNEIIWFSERDGCAHFYLHDLNTGKLKNAITEGEWVVRNLLHVDLGRRELFIQSSGRVPGNHLHYGDICRVNIDTGELTPVATSNDEHTVCDGRDAIVYGEARGVSANGKYIALTRSRVDTVPVSLLLDRDGNTLMEIETADVSALMDGMPWPESLKFKGADGKTDIYGVVFKPSGFSLDKKYPVIDSSHYFCFPTGSFSNSSHGFYLDAALLAELGFIVVMIAPRGSGMRDAKFNHTDRSLMAANNQADCVAWIRQLAEHYSYIDIDRVGISPIYGSVSSPLVGMFEYPDFYKVGVNISSAAYGRLNSSFGLYEGDWPDFEEMAENFKGKLLLIHGMMDDVIPVAITFRVVEALQKANKDFDMLILPNLGHSYSSYGMRRAWDHYVKHLLGIEPPKNFKLKTGYDLYKMKLAKMQAEKS